MGEKTLVDQNVVFTGTLAQIKRAEAAKKAILAGATVLSSLTKATTLIVAGADAGAKLDKARAQGIEIWDEATFLAVCAGGGNSITANAAPVSTPSRGAFSSPQTKAERLKKTPQPKLDVRSDSIDGKHLCFTGALRIKRAKATALAEKAGATVHSSVTNKVDIVITAYAPGQKLIKAMRNGCEVWNEANFFEAVNYEPVIEDENEGDEEDDEDDEADEDDNGGDNDNDHGNVNQEEAKSLKGKNVVFTGTLTLLKRADASKKAVAAGAKVLSSLTKACNLVVAGEDAGAKLDKARDDGIEIWSEQEFVDAVGGASVDATTPKSKAKTPTPSKKRKAEEEEEEEEEGEDDEAAAGDAAQNDTEHAPVTSLAGQNVVFTGTLALLKRADASKKAVAAGAKVLSSYTKATTLVVAGADAGVKLDKAREEGIPIWTEQEFVDAVGGLPATPVKSPSKAKAATPTKKAKASPSTEDAAASDAINSSALSGKNLVFTGTLTLLKRADASKKAVAAGAKVLSSLTKACNLVVAGEDAGAKLEKARDDGIEIWTEQQFIDALGGEE
ncbi:hypothetical protein BDR26DRAFT_852178 [Obelidium mucronatum]|nr:hypothetical protein BDR26DRAFT_852178 [Obelidium mucronatum]